MKELELISAIENAYKYSNIGIKDINRLLEYRGLKKVGYRLLGDALEGFHISVLKQLKKDMEDFIAFDGGRNVEPFIESLKAQQITFTKNTWDSSHLPLVTGRYYMTIGGEVLRARQIHEIHPYIAVGKGTTQWREIDTGRYVGYSIDHPRSIKEEVFFKDLGKTLKVGRSYELVSGEIIQIVSDMKNDYFVGNNQGCYHGMTGERYHGSPDAIIRIVPKAKK